MADFEAGSRVLVTSGPLAGKEGTVRGRSGQRYSVEVQAHGRTVKLTLRPNELAPPGDRAALWRKKLDQAIARRERGERFAWWADKLADPPGDAEALIALDEACQEWLEGLRHERDTRRSRWHARLETAIAGSEDPGTAWQSLETELAEQLAPPPLEPAIREATRRLMQRSQRAVKAGGEPSYDREREHIAAALDVSVRSGYGTFDEVRERVVDHVRTCFSCEEPRTVDAEIVHFEALLRREWEAQRQLEASWSGSTTNDRLDAAFEALAQQGIVALQDAGYTMSDGWEDIHEARRRVDGAWGGVFFHRQDVERAVDGRGLMLAFGAFARGDDHEPQSLRLGREVCKVLAAHDIATEWDGTLQKRIAIPPFAWQKRRVSADRW